VNVTPIWQLLPAGTGFGVQPADKEKSPALAPEILIPETSSAAPPEFRIVTFCGTLATPSLCAANVRLGGETCSDGPAIAAPYNATC
jgi:hypothetical protein